MIHATIRIGNSLYAVMRKRRYIHFIVGVLFAFMATSLVGQEPVDTTLKSPLTEISNSFFYDTKDNSKHFNGDVRLWQDSLILYCDTAIIIGENVNAFGNVVIVQSDTIQIFCDSLNYDKDIGKANLYKDVILLNGDDELRTDTLNYDVNTKTASYQSGANLRSKSALMYSKRGEYKIDQKQAKFYNNVNVRDSSMILRTDSLLYKANERRVFFISPTRITHKESQIYCEQGSYGLEDLKGVFEKNAQYQKGEMIAIADQMLMDGKISEIRLIGNARYQEEDRLAEGDLIIYNEETEKSVIEGNAHYKDAENEVYSEYIAYDAKSGTYNTSGRSSISDPPMILIAEYINYDKSASVGFARGQVYWQDTSSNLGILCDEMIFNQESDEVKAIGTTRRPLLQNYASTDTLNLAADTLVSFQLTNEGDTLQFFKAYKNVQIFRDDMQAVSDSLVYNASDSVFILYQNPMIWSDTTQFSGDTIRMFMSNENIDQIEIRDNGFIISMTPEELYNQIKGRDITADFKERKIHQMIVEGNAESIYYLQNDEKAYIGMNQTICSRMKFLFSKDELEDIHFYTQPTSVMTPMSKALNASARLAGFNWVPGSRPKNIEQIVAKN